MNARYCELKEREVRPGCRWEWNQALAVNKDPWGDVGDLHRLAVALSVDSDCAVRARDDGRVGDGTDLARNLHVDLRRRDTVQRCLDTVEGAPIGSYRLGADLTGV